MELLSSKTKTKKLEGRFLGALSAPVTASLVQSDFFGDKRYYIIIWIILVKIFSSAPSFKKYRDY